MKTRGSNGTSLDEQPTQEITLEQQPAEELNLEQQDSEQQPAQSMEAAQEDPDEQPTQEITLEQQSTLPIIVEQQPAQSMEAAQEDLEQQPTEELNLEQQSTLQMVAEQQDLEQLPAQSIAAKKQNPEQQKLALPLSKMLHHGSRKSPLLWVPLILFLLLMIGVLTGRPAIASWLSHVFTHNQTLVEEVHHPPLTSTQLSLIDETAKSFMDTMVRKDWAAMWSMLSPDAQQLWHGEKDFIHFEQAKYGSLTFVSYNDSPAQMQYSWRDPDTTQVYPEVATQRISLTATAPQGLLSKPSNLALSKGLFDNTLFALILNHGNWQVLVAGPADLDAPILVPASPPKTKLLVPIFMYHHVSNVMTRDYLDFNLTVTTTNFDAQLSWFQRQGYHSITMTELFDALYYGKALPAHPIILTFDDGFKDMFTDALPALLAHHYRGVFYIITGMIGGRYMTWKQVRILAQDGMQIASHTIHHVNVGQPPAWTSTQNELLHSKETLEAQLGQPIQFFCYPVGEPFHHDPVYEQQLVLADLFNDGYVGATLDPFSFDSAIQNAQTPYQLPRIRASGGESMQLFVSILNYTLNIGAYRLAHGFAS